MSAFRISVWLALWLNWWITCAGAPPVITKEPVDQTVGPGADAIFDVVVEGESLQYQWRHNGVNLPGATNSELRVSNVFLDSTGSYDVVVQNESGTVQSRVAILRLSFPKGAFVLFDNRPTRESDVTSGVGRVTDPARNVYAAGRDYLAQLWAGLALDQLQPAGPAVPFLTGTNAGLWTPTVVQLPYVEAGNLVWVQARVWQSGLAQSFTGSVEAGAPFGVSAVQMADAVSGEGRFPQIWSYSRFALDSRLRPQLQRSLTNYILVPTPTFSGAASQWSFNGLPIPGATNATLVLTNLPLPIGGTFELHASLNGRKLWSDALPYAAQSRTGGTIEMVNRRSPILDAPVFDEDGTTRLSGSAFLVQVYAGFTPSHLIPIGPATPFREGVAAGYFSGGDLAVPNDAPGSVAYVQVRAWGTGKALTFEESAALGAKIGASGTFPVVTGGAGAGVPSLSALLSGLRSFKIGYAPVVGVVPADQAACLHGTASFRTETFGHEPMEIQWLFNRMPIPGANHSQLKLVNVLSNAQGTYTVRVSNPSGSLSVEAQLLLAEPVQVREAPAPISATSPRVLAFGAEGSPTLHQWRVNGVPFVLNSGPVSSVLAPFGTITVAARNAFSSTVSPPYLLLPDLPVESGADRFQDRRILLRNSGTLLTENFLAKSENSEPRHAGKAPGKSIWFSWTAPEDGDLTLSTEGSSFDTLLAVYTGISLASLSEIASQDDGGLGLTSLLTVRVVAGTQYAIAVDGFAEASGYVQLSWMLHPGAFPIPQIRIKTNGIVARAGSPVGVEAIPDASTPISWAVGGGRLWQQTNSVLRIQSITPGDVGTYQAYSPLDSWRGNPYGPVHGSKGVTVELELDNPRAEALLHTSSDKMADALEAGPALRVAAGDEGTRVFSSSGSTLELGEPNHAGVIGSASRWLLVQTDSAALLELKTQQSDFPSAVAVYTWTRGDFPALMPVASDVGGGEDGLCSQLGFHSEVGGKYLVAVDGQGLIYLHYRLIAKLTEARFGTLALTRNGLLLMPVFSDFPVRALLQRSSNLRDWLPWLNTSVSPSGVVVFDDHSPLEQLFYQGRLP